MWSLLRSVSWPEFRHHPWRNLAALFAVTLGVALAFSVQLINQSALSEFSAAVRSVNGQPDFEIRGQRGGFDEAVYERVAVHPNIAWASPVIEFDTEAIDAQGERIAVRVLGVDALAVAPLSPALMPRPADGADRLAMLDPGVVFLNGAASERLGNPSTLRARTPTGQIELRVQGNVAAGGPPLAVIDIAGAQSQFGWLGRLSRIDVRLRPGADRDQTLRSLNLPTGVRAISSDESAQRVSNVSRAYRVNLTVLALVALFTGAFLVFSILSLSVAKRQPQLALLGVLGLSARERLALVLTESALLGVVGSLLGLALGAALASLALRLLAGDLGGGYFPGVAPQLQFSSVAALIYGALGVAAAVIGGWVPARAAQRLAPAQALKGLGDSSQRSSPVWLGPALLAIGTLLAQLPPLFEMPLAAYVSVACLLFGGIACVPAAVGALLRLIPTQRHALSLLAIERARHQRNTATIAVAGVVASLSLAVALTVMVTSFRVSMTQWLDAVLPADLYVRAKAVGANSNDVTVLPAALVRGAASLPGVDRVRAQRSANVQLSPTRPAVALLARQINDAASELPLVGELHAAPPGQLPIYVSEAVASLYGAQPGKTFALPLPNGDRATAFVGGIWRDYAHQHGAVLMNAADYQRLTGDTNANDMALWLRGSADIAQVQQALRGLQGDDGAPIEFASAGQLRDVSLRIFDRSFAVTYWLQAVAIAIGLFGIAASFSAQVLARRKEFGLLSHLGLTRRQILSVVAAEGAVWTAAGALIGLLLGLAVSVVLVKVVNPQSFNWTMEMVLPWARLIALCGAVVASGTLTAWIAARGAAQARLALAVKEDW